MKVYAVANLIGIPFGSGLVLGKPNPSLLTKSVIFKLYTASLQV